MADIYSGYKRSLKCHVSKKLNGVEEDGYPKQYPTATDIANGYFTYNAVQYDIPTPAELSTMSQSAYDSLLATFKLYVESIEPGASFATDTIVQPTIYDPSGCAVDIPTTTTTTTTTTVLDPATTYEITSNGEGYGSTQTIFTVTGAQAGDIVTIELSFTGILEIDPGYSSTRARVYALYPGGYSQALSECYSDGALHPFSITKEVSFIATGPTFTITTETYKINSLNIEGVFQCGIISVDRGGDIVYMSKFVTGRFETDIQPTFSC